MIRVSKIIILCLFFGLKFPSPTLAAIELAISTESAVLISDQELVVDVTLSGAKEDAEYYIRGVFYPPDTSNYFGYTLNQLDEWHQQSTEFQQFFHLIGNQTQTMRFKLDTEASAFSGSGLYYFKVGRYTPAGTLTWSNQAPVQVTIHHDMPTPAPTPTSITTINNSHLEDPEHIFLSEVYACAESGSSEWLELLNDNDYEVALTNWFIRDNSQSNKNVFSLTIPAHSLGIVETQSLLNNTGDQVKLHNSQGQTVDLMEYEVCDRSRSWIKHQGIWRETLTVTKGFENQLTAPQNTPPPTAKTFSPTPRPSPSATPINSPLTSPSVTEEHEEDTVASSSATISGLILGTSLETISKETPTQPQTNASAQDNSPSTLPLFSLGFGLVLLSLGVFGTYQWYNSSYRF